MLQLQLRLNMTPHKMAIIPLLCKDTPHKLRFYKPKDDGMIPQPALLMKQQSSPSPLWLPLSFPVSVYLSAEQPDGPNLQNSQTLSTRWVQHVDQDYLIFASLRAQPDHLTTTATFIVKDDSTTQHRSGPWAVTVT